MPSDRDILFQEFAPAQRESFLTLGTVREYAPQQTIVEEDKMGSEMVLIEDGVISVWSRGAKVNELGPESLLGASALILPHARTATLVAETAVRLLHFTRARVLQHLETCSPRLFQAFFVNAFRIHMNLIRQCEERIVQLTRELDTL